MTGLNHLHIGLFIPSRSRDYDTVESALWIRALQMVEPLEALGYEVSVNNPFRRYDVAIYHRGMRRNAVRIIKFLKHTAKRVYWDTCVDYFDPHEACDAEQVECARKIAQLVEGICVPTNGIAESARRFNDNVFVMPDPVCLDYFSPIKTRIEWDSPVFGWSGVSHKACFLNPYAQFLGGRTLIISEKPPDLPFDYQFSRWRYGSFCEDLLKCDIAFLPRRLDSTYTANNSSFKALVFAVLGIPIIANALPSYRELAQHFDAIAFLEDFDDDPQRAMESLRGKDCSPERVRQAYDRTYWAHQLAGWLHG
jgi:hypothetical protein